MHFFWQKMSPSRLDSEVQSVFKLHLQNQAEFSRLALLWRPCKCKHYSITLKKGQIWDNIKIWHATPSMGAWLRVQNLQTHQNSKWAPPRDRKSFWTARCNLKRCSEIFFFWPYRKEIVYKIHVFDLFQSIESQEVLSKQAIRRRGT